MEDQRLIELFFQRDETAIRETEQKYGKICFGIANHILNNPSDAEECVNDTYMGMWNAIPPAKPEHFAAFLYKMTRNVSLKKLRFNQAEKRNEKLAVPFSELEEILPDESCAPQRSDEYLSGLISDFLKAEKPDARNVFVRRYWFFDSVEEIAARYSFSESKVKSMLFRVRKRMKEYLIREGVRL